NRASLVLAAAALAVAVGVSTRPAAGAQSKKPATCSATIGVMGGFTGARAAIGQEELNFSRLAVALFNKRNHSKIRLPQGAIHGDPHKAATVAQQVLSKKKIVAPGAPGRRFSGG